MSEQVAQPRPAVSDPSGKQLVLVLGMHRSGTSALAGALVKSGMSAGVRLLPPTPDNPKGYFENQTVVDVQDRLLESLDRRWLDPRPLPADWLQGDDASRARGELADVVAELLGRSAKVMVKDPRSCRLLPLWERVAGELGVSPSALLTFRHPLEVAASLHKRDGMSRNRALLLWMRYLLDAEQGSRGMPRAWVAYDALMQHWRPELARIDRALDLGLDLDRNEAALGEFLDPGLRTHSEQGTASGPSSPSPFEALALELHALALLAAGGQDPGPAKFDAIAARLEPVSDAYMEIAQETLAMEVPQQVEAELRRQGLDQSRIETGLKLAAVRELWRPATIARAPGSSKLYYRSDDAEFIEERTVLGDPTMVDGWLQVAFDLPEGAQVDHLRLDPDEAPGLYAVQSLSIDGEPVPDLARRCSSFNEMSLPTRASPAAVRIAALGEDPHFHVDVRGLAVAHGRGIRVEMRFRPETVATEVGIGMHEVAADLRDLYGGMQERQDRIEARLEEHQSHQATRLDDIEMRLAALDDIHGRLAALDDLNARQATRLGDIEMRLAALDDINVRLAALDEETNRSRSDAHATLDRLDALHSRLHVLEAAQVRQRDWLDRRIGEAMAAVSTHQDDRFATLQSQQAILLQWAQRRSPGYWLRRLRTAAAELASVFRPVRSVGTRHMMSLTPLANVVRGPDAAGALGWTSTGDDPQFLVEHAQGPLAGGWYLFEACFGEVDGVLRSPCLYPDYGHGISEQERILLPEPDAGHRVHGLVRLAAEARRLRFDPSDRRAAFVLPGLAMVPLTRMQALRLMLSGAASGSIARMLSLAASFSKDALTGGLRDGAERLYARYLEARKPDMDGYAEWVRVYDTLSAEELKTQSAAGASLSDGPVISVVMPVYQPPERWLRKCIESVIAQTYPRWELCIADDASTKPYVRTVLEEYARKDSRIRVAYRSENGHIAAASNTALEMATGEYMALLDHDDELAPNALFEVVKGLAAHPEWRLLYSDEDKIDENGRRFDPYFKPDWNHELFLAQNCLSHLGVYEARLVAEVGGFRTGYDGSQDWDLALRCIERLRPSQIGHIPRILYHWRAISGSTALAPSQKDYTADAGWRAVTEHLQRTGVDASVKVTADGLIVHRALPDPPPRVSLLVPTRDKVDLLRTCVESILRKTDYPDYEILVVDNQSSEPATLEYFRELLAEPRVRVIPYHEPFNYSALNNHAAAMATGSIIGLVNNDIEVISGDWMQLMAAQAARPEIGAVGAMLLYPDDTIQHAGVILGLGGVAGHAYVGLSADASGNFSRARLAQDMSAVTAACLFVRKDIFDEVGGLDESLVVAFNDIDFCLRVRARGYRNLWTPYARLYHHESASRGYEDTPEKQARFNGEAQFMHARWGEQLVHDPAYNPNLSLDSCCFELAFPPRVTS